MPDINQTEYENVLVQITSINGYYTIPIISLVGFLLNSTCLVVFLNPKFNYKNEFKYVILKVAIETVGCLILIGFQNYLICIFEPYVISTLHCSKENTLMFQVYRLYIYKFFNYIIYVWSGLNEILLSYDRHLILKNKKNWFNEKGNFKYIVFACLSLMIILNIPALFAYRITPARTEHLYYLESTNFGKSVYHSSLILCVLVASNVLTISILIPIMIMVALEFRVFLRRKVFLTASINTANIQTIVKRKEDLKFSKMALIMIFLFAISRLTDLANTLMYRIILIKKIKNLYSFVYLDNITYIIFATFACSNFFILLNSNKIFRCSFKNLFRRRNKTINS